jgi:hypothetical protein
VDLPGLERGAQRRALAEQVALADDVVERARAQPDRERPVGRRLRGLRLARVARIEEPIYPRSIPRGASWPTS